jgi:UDP-glucose 6-dehydrogenase
VKNAVALVVSTEWADYQAVDVETILSEMKALNVLDPNRFLQRTFGSDPRVHYIAVGKALL